MRYDQQPISELQRQHEVEHMLGTMRKGQIDVRLGEQQIALGRKLGEGGSKSVYEASMDDGIFALAVPNDIDGYRVLTEKWAFVMQEPTNTARMRDLGLLANPVCELLPTSITSIAFPTVRMKRYQDLPFDVRDRKNGSSSIHRSTFVPQDGFTDENFKNVFSNITPDIVVLLRNNIFLHQDSINISVQDGKPRLYLNDLGNVEWNGTASKMECDYYAQVVIRALSSALTDGEWQQNKDFFGIKRYMTKDGSRYFDSFGEDIFEKLKSEV